MKRNYSKLIPGTESYMEEDLPVSENTPEDGLSDEVDENGQPFPDDVQDRIRSDQGTEEVLKMANRMEVYEESYTWKEKTDGRIPYCPVYCQKKPDGNGRIFVSYLNGTIEDVDDYVDLIDSLLMATENDTYFIFEDSPGGLVASGGIISSAIHHSKADVYTVARGLCASAAALIHSAAKPGHSLVSSFAVIMYHMSMHYDSGSSNLLKMRAENQVRYVNECLLNKAVADGSILPEELEKIQNGEEIFLTAAQYIERTKAKGEQTNE